MNSKAQTRTAVLEVIVAGTPKREIQPDNKAEAQDSAVASVIGIASGQRVYRSMHVNRYV